jgi:hypothetical protein
MEAQLVEALCYKPEGRWFDSQSGHWFFVTCPNPSSGIMVLGSTQPLTEMIPRHLCTQARKADKLTAIC